MNKNLSYIEKLEEQIDNIGLIIDEMLDNSSIYYHDINANSNVLVIGASSYHWDKKDEKNQIKAKSKYLDFYSNFNLLIDKANPSTKRKIKEVNNWIINLIEQNRAPSSIENGKSYYRKQTQTFKDFLKLLSSESNKTIILPDTNSIIQYPEPKTYSNISSTEKFDFIILPTILSELDKHKMTHRNDDFRKKVTSVIKRLKGYRKQGNVLDGVTVNKTITVKMIATEPNFEKTLSWIDSKNNDDRIIANALELQICYPGDSVIFVTSDINLQNKAQLANLTVFDTDELE
ncbi:PIN domain-containing protein [uncultured Algibacter sp.]|uniref:PIN domain-containing protein n=1 Tax=uncultured Algibacter sp. TaxID=298659 RepID=UPI0026212FE8|nr:PIN domain-containing protein [uncultured Algibacter sp.]